MAGKERKRGYWGSEAQGMLFDPTLHHPAFVAASKAALRVVEIASVIEIPIPQKLGAKVIDLANTASATEAPAPINA